MIPALLRGKLSREQENMEDLLTSCVFGVLQHLPPEEGLLRWLGFAVGAANDWSPRLPTRLTDVSYEFWPWLSPHDSAGAEPDVLIRGTDEHGARHATLIEAKYRSGKSSEADPDKDHPSDQLAREWHCLIANVADDETPHLIYLTADFGPPVDEIVAAAQEFTAKRPVLAQKYPFKCVWLSWRHLVPAFAAASRPELRELDRLAARLDLGFFSGVRPLTRPMEESWRFHVTSIIYDYPVPDTNAVQWRFRL